MNTPHKTQAADATDKTVRKKRILIVDDDVAVREALVHVLAGENFAVLSAANGAEALEIATTTLLDLVLLDLNMPVQGGWETFEKLRTANPVLPVIVITARPNQFFTAVGAGVGALLEKPLDFPKLLKTIRDLLMEPNETRWARLIGKPSPFHYLPARNSAPMQLE